jgi:hypothetical protein
VGRSRWKFAIAVPAQLALTQRTHTAKRIANILLV